MTENSVSIKGKADARLMKELRVLESSISSANLINEFQGYICETFLNDLQNSEPGTTFPEYCTSKLDELLAQDTVTKPEAIAIMKSMIIIMDRTLESTIHEASIESDLSSRQISSLRAQLTARQDSRQHPDILPIQYDKENMDSFMRTIVQDMQKKGVTRSALYTKFMQMQDSFKQAYLELCSQQESISTKYK